MDERSRQSYKCVRAEGPITVDGLLDESSWLKAAVLEFVIPGTHEEPLDRTEGRLLWDDDCLYAGFRAYDRDVWSYHTKRGAQTCEDDVLELFFKTHSEREPYYNFEINALNTVYDACNARRLTPGGATLSGPRGISGLCEPRICWPIMMSPGLKSL